MEKHLNDRNEIAASQYSRSGKLAGIAIPPNFLESDAYRILFVICGFSRLPKIARPIYH